MHEHHAVHRSDFSSATPSTFSQRQLHELFRSDTQLHLDRMSAEMICPQIHFATRLPHKSFIVTTHNLQVAQKATVFWNSCYLSRHHVLVQKGTCMLEDICRSTHCLRLNTLTLSTLQSAAVFCQGGKHHPCKLWCDMSRILLLGYLCFVCRAWSGIFGIVTVIGIPRVSHPSLMSLLKPQRQPV